MESFLPLLWFFLLSGTLLLFVILDGADLGIGIISLLAREDRKPQILNAVGPLWYANETWLVITGGTLFGAFPLAYSVVLSSLYIPAMMLLFGLIFRAVSTEFRSQVHQQRFWNRALGIGCLVAALGQGFLLGGLLTNPGAISTSGANPWSWFNPYSILIALGVAAAYTMIGAAYIIKQKEVNLTPDIWRFLRYAGLLTLLLFLISMVLVPLVPSEFSRAWLLGHRLIVVPTLGAVTIFFLAALLLRSRHETRGKMPYTWSVAAFLGIGSTTIAAILPYIIPFSISIPEASSSTSSLIFMLFGVGMLLPIIIFYNLYVRHVFSEKANKVAEK